MSLLAIVLIKCRAVIVFVVAAVVFVVFGGVAAVVGGVMFGGVAAVVGGVVFGGVAGVVVFRELGDGISLKQLSLLAIVLIIAGSAAAAVGGVVGGVVVGGCAAAVISGAALIAHRHRVKRHNCYYQAYIFYKRMGPKKWHMNLAVTQDTQYSKCLQDLSSSADFGEKHSHFRFHFSTNTFLSRERNETSERESDTEMMLKLSGFPADGIMTAGWRVQPLRIPPIIKRRDVDDYNQSKSASPPYIPVLICAHPNTSDFEEQLQYPLTIEGIEVIDITSRTPPDHNPPKIVLDAYVPFVDESS